jgi:hypothetical protein
MVAVAVFIMQWTGRIGKEISNFAENNRIQKF